MRNLSIIIPAYNVEKYIGYTLKSLLSNEKKAFEIVVVDDGSTDNTVKVVNDIMAKNTNIDFKLIRKENGGVSSARNRGLAAANGKYVLFLDGDDYVSNHLIDRIYKAIDSQKQDLDIICWGYKKVCDYTQTIDDKNSSQFELFTGLDVFRNILVRKNMEIFIGSSAYNKHFLATNNLQFYEGCAAGEDTEFIFKALSRANNVLYMRDILTYYVQRRGSATKSYNIRRFDAVFAMKRLEGYFDTNNEFGEIFLRYRDALIIYPYLNSFQSCLNYLTKRRIPSKTDIAKLLCELERYYPGLNEEIMAMMSRYSYKDRTWIKVRAFLMSPILYNFLINFWRAIRERN